MKRSVRLARFHQSLHLPGAGELSTTLPPQGKTLDELEMFATEMGLIAKFKFRGIKHEVLVPSANIILMALNPEPATKAEESKK